VIQKGKISEGLTVAIGLVIKGPIHLTQTTLAVKMMFETLQIEVQSLQMVAESSSFCVWRHRFCRQCSLL